MPKDLASKIVISVLLILIGAMVYVFYFYAEVTSKDVNRGYSKAAKKNPYLAAELYLHARDVEAEFSLRYTLLDNIGRSSSESEAIFQSNDTLVLENIRGIVSGPRYDKVMRWVSQGGTVVLSLDNVFLGERASDELSKWLGVSATSIDYSNDDNSEEAPSTSSENKVPEIGPSDKDKQTKNSSKKVEAKSEDSSFVYSDTSACYAEQAHQIRLASAEEIDVYFYGRPSFIALGEHKPAWFSAETHGNNPPYVSAASFPYGDGHIHVIRSSGLWRNPWIQCHDNAYFLWSLINPQGKVWIIENRDAPSLFVLLWRYLQMGVWWVMASVTILLWFAFMRVGPAFEYKESTRRRFVEHIKADAVFVWKRRGLGALLEALRVSTTRRLLRKIHGYENKSTDEKIASIRQFIDIDAQAIGFALFEKNIKNHSEFINAIKVLKRLKEQL